MLQCRARRDLRLQLAALCRDGTTSVGDSTSQSRRHLHQLLAAQLRISARFKTFQIVEGGRTRIWAVPDLCLAHRWRARGGLCPISTTFAEAQTDPVVPQPGSISNSTDFPSELMVNATLMRFRSARGPRLRSQVGFNYPIYKSCPPWSRNRSKAPRAPFGASGTMEQSISPLHMPVQKNCPSREATGAQHQHLTRPEEAPNESPGTARL